MSRLILCADIDPATGYGIHAARIVHDFENFGYEVVVRPTAYRDGSDCPVDDFIKTRMVFDVQSEPWELLLHYPSQWPSPTKQVVYFTMAESSRPTPEQVEKINRARVAVVPCKWNAQCFKESGVTIPIHVIPLGFDESIFKPSPLKLDGPCVFGTAGRLIHGATRKGCNRVIDCFLRAFPKERDVRLVVKGFPDCQIEAVDDPRISVIKKYLTTEGVAEFLSSLTCFVSAARGEGFGLLQLEACAVGRPVIASIFGGLAEFLSERNCYAVQYRMVEADEKYTGRGTWALPDETQIIAQMRQVYQDRQRAREVGEIAAVSVRHLTWTNSNRSLEAVLKTRGALNGTAKPGSGWPHREPIIVRRSLAIGDALAATCVAEKLIGLGHQVLFQAHPAIHPVLRYTGLKLSTPEAPCHIDLDGAYEQHPQRRSLTFAEIYTESANRQMEKYGLKIESPLGCAPALQVPEAAQAKALEFLGKHPQPWIGLNPRSAHWVNRTVPDQIWKEAARGTGGTCFWMGMEPGPKSIVDLSLRQLDPLVTFTACLDLVVTPDTGPMHIAAALGVPLIAVEQASAPRLHLSDTRDWRSVSPELACLNCQDAICRIVADKPPCQEIPPGLIVDAIRRRLETKVSAVIPVYRSNTERLNRCLDCVLPQVDEVIVAVDGDGHPPPGLREHPKIQVVRNWTGRQLGYGKNANHGVRHSSGQWVLLLNDDVFLQADYVRHLLREVQPDTGILAGLLRYPNGRIQFGGKIRGPGGVGWGHIDHQQTEPSIKSTREMECVTHAAVLIRREAFYQSGAYPECLHLYYEDDWSSLAIRQAGWKILYCPSAQAVHEEHQTTKALGQSGFDSVMAASAALFQERWRKYFEHNRDCNVIGNFNYL